MRKRLAEVDPPEIVAFQAAIVQLQEDNWDFARVPESERARLRPAVLSRAKAIGMTMRADHAARTRR